MPAKKAPTKPRASTQKWIRNIREVPVSIRLDTGRRIELLPRGRRGDSVPVSATEIKDEKFRLNKDLLFEVITETQANNVIDKQDTNRLQVHPAMSQIRNAKGEEYANPPAITPELEVKGTQVGTIDDRGMIKPSDSNGSTNNPIREKQELTLEEQDEIARRSDLDGPAAGIGNLKVTKGDVQPG